MASETVKVLPDEILSLVCQEFGLDRDFSSLYRCALSAKSLADPALRILYQYHEQSPTFIQSDDLDGRQRETTTFAAKAAEQDLRFRNWTQLWRSIILSSFDGETYKPYCRYLRILDFRNLASMLEDTKFVARHRLDFFSGRLKPFFFLRHDSRRHVIDMVATINAVGDAICQRKTLLEEISGQLSPAYLPRWITLSPRLESLVLWHGDAVEPPTGTVIRSNCQSFKNLTIREWRQPDADQVCAEFLESVKRDTLQHFEMISFSNIEIRSFQALGYHGRSLRVLKLGSLSPMAMENLNALKECVGIHTLLLEDSFGTTRLEFQHEDVFNEVIQWLSSCISLRDLTMIRLIDGPAVLAQVLSSPTVNLTKLSLEGYTVRNEESALFHTALEAQSGLESVWLKGQGENATDADLTIMVQSLCTLPNLRELVLKEVSDEFQEHHIANLALSLPLLEDFWTSGEELSDDILPVLANLKSLKVLTLYAMTQFSFQAIVDFLSMLDKESQKGFNFQLMAVDSGYDLPEEELVIIRDVIRSEFEGKFEFVLWRDADPSDSDDN